MCNYIMCVTSTSLYQRQCVLSRGEENMMNKAVLCEANELVKPSKSGQACLPFLFFGLPAMFSQDVNELKIMWEEWIKHVLFSLQTNSIKGILWNSEQEEQRGSRKLRFMSAIFVLTHTVTTTALDLAPGMTAGCADTNFTILFF